MARIRSISGQTCTSLDRGWCMALAAEVCPPADAAGWIGAPVPGTAAQAIENAGKSTPDLLQDLQRRHIWYTRALAPGPRRLLHFAGLAPHAEIFLEQTAVVKVSNMFDSVTVELPENKIETNIYIHFPPFIEASPTRGFRRQRWRPHLISAPHLRNAYTGLIGHMPGWCPPVPPVGPYRRVELIGDGPVLATAASVRTWLEDVTGIIEISIEINGMEGTIVAACWNAAAPLERQPDGRWKGRLAIDRPPLWWPHTHGNPHLLPLTIHGVDMDEQAVEIALGSVGFRTIELDRGADGEGFGLIVNGEPVFCRGANWVPDLHLSAEPEAHEPALRRMRDAGMNMLRVSGIMGRASPALFDLADRFGILVIHDEPFANFDYDFDSLSEAFGLERSLRQFLEAVETSPSLVVITGGSEMAQQGAMLSLPAELWNLDDYGEKLASRVHAVRPDVMVVPNSPYGGALPFQPDAGLSHYFGVGAYCRPLEDARRARVRFATESLAFSCLPQPERMAFNVGSASPGTPEWKRLVVRDLKADWDFEDTRDFYLKLLYDVEPARLRATDPQRYLDLSFAVPGEVMAATFAEWRRVGSETRGGLVWFNRDIAPGLGWGVVDAGNVPKPPWYALRRAFAPLTVMVTDEGLNGLHCHVINETAVPHALRLTLACYGADGAIVIDGARDLAMAPRTGMRLTSADLFGIFFDVTYAYRFGPPAHEFTVARLTDAEGSVLAEAFHFPHGRGHEFGPRGLAAQLESDGGLHHILVVTTARLAQSVHIACEGFEPEDDWFHLAPGQGRRIRLKGRGRPRGIVSAVNGTERVTFG